MWRTADAVHIDLRGLEPPEPMVAVLQTIESGEVDTALVGYFDREPIFLYPELEDRGWSHELLESHCGSADCEDGIMLVIVRWGFMSIAATFLGGAKSRLLPASIPFRFFAAAAVFHVLLWLVLLAGAGEAVGFRGGLGSTLASVHLLTLGVLTTTAIGASVQLLPVATRRTLHAVWPIKLVFWLTVPGMLALMGGMYLAQTSMLITGAVITTAGLLLYCGLLADNLRRASGLAVVGAYGWTALVALAIVIVLGVALAFNEKAGFLPDHGAAALAHLILGAFGFMGLLVLGFSHILVPMFALAAATAKRASYILSII